MRKKSEARRHAILDAAKSAFEELGFEQTTMSDIAARLGGSKATLYNYFSSKEALFLELIQHTAERDLELLAALLKRKPMGDGCQVANEDMVSTLALLRPSDDLALTLRSFGERAMRMLYTPQKQAARRMLITAAVDEKIGRYFYERGSVPGMKLLADYFASVIAAGQLRPADTGVMAAHFRALMESEVMDAWQLNALPPLTEEYIAGCIERAVTVFLAAYATR